MSTITHNQPTQIFVYGTLKRNFPNHHLIHSLTATNDAVFLGKSTTFTPYPLVCGPFNIPFLLDLPGSGYRVKGELYSVTARALAQLDELEGVNRGHYERLPLEVTVMEEGEGDGRVTVAEGYFGDKSFAEKLWVKNGRVGMEEYGTKDGEMYVGVKDRDVGLNLRDYIREFLKCDGVN